MADLVGRVKGGAVAGLEATAAMSAVMWSAQRAGFVGKQAPKQVVQRSLGAAGQSPADESSHNATSLVVHFAFGGATGAIYGALAERLRLDRAPIVTGIAFGLVVWAATYKVTFPLLHVMPPPERDRPGRARTMVLAHVVYGAVLGGRTGRRLNT